MVLFSCNKTLTLDRPKIFDVQDVALPMPVEHRLDFNAFAQIFFFSFADQMRQPGVSPVQLDHRDNQRVAVGRMCRFLVINRGKGFNASPTGQFHPVFKLGQAFAASAPGRHIHDPAFLATDAEDFLLVAERDEELAATGPAE